MSEAENASVEHLSAHAHRFWCTDAIDRIAEDGEARVSEVGTDLVLPSGEQFHLEEG
jgi:hypothetical protein